MVDTNLADDDAKWVRYSVWYLKRGKESILQSGEDLVTKNFGPDRYKVSKIYSFMRDVEHQAETHPDRLPKRWKVLFNDDGTGLRDDVADLLDVRFEVVDRTNREDLHKDQEQLDRLQGIEMLHTMRRLAKRGEAELQDVIAALDEILVGQGWRLQLDRWMTFFFDQGFRRRRQPDSGIGARFVVVDRLLNP